MMTHVKSVAPSLLASLRKSSALHTLIVMLCAGEFFGVGSEIKSVVSTTSMLSGVITRFE